jgi:hypothetical protein
VLVSLSAALFILVAFVAVLIGALAVLGPSGSFSVGYLLVAGACSHVLYKLLRNNSVSDGVLQKRPSKAVVVIVLLTNIAGGIASFIVYWSAREHLLALKVLTAFSLCSVLFIKFGGGRIDQS